MAHPGMTDRPPTRGEFELLRQIVAGQGARLETIDSSGTKGVAVVQAQMTDVVKDLAELKTEVNVRFDSAATGELQWHKDHLAMHEQERRDRVTGRRWLIGTAVAGMASMTAVLALLVDVLNHVH